MNKELSINTSTLSCGSKFFAPVDTSQLQILFTSYKMQKDKIIAMFNQVSGDENSHTLDYFTNSRWDPHHHKHFDPRSVFQLKPAIAYLNATFWKMAINLTDVYDHMPSKDRNDWDEMIRDHTTLDFEEELVIDTLVFLLNNREAYLSQRVQDIFEGLSGEHVTNSPQAFNKRMIFGYGDSKIGLVNDLRSVIAKFSDRGPVQYNSTSVVIKDLYRLGYTGQFIELDGGAIKLKVFLKETKHLEVHQDICWRLNEILAINNPKAIPSEFRTKPKKKYKEFDYNQNLLSFKVLKRLDNLTTCCDYSKKESYRRCRPIIENRFSCFDSMNDKHTTQLVEDVMIACGGIRTNLNGHDFQFDYNFLELVPEIIQTGSLPEKRSYQFYPTNSEIGKIAADILDIKEGDSCCEPEAGQGGLLKFMPKDTTAIEISSLQCNVLKLKGYNNVINQDFINYSNNTNKYFDKILMNPPFSQLQHEQHLHAAMKLLTDSGELVAILPSSAKNLPQVFGFDYQWGDEIEKAFTGVQQVIRILKVFRNPL